MTANIALWRDVTSVDSPAVSAHLTLPILIIILVGAKVSRAS